MTVEPACWWCYAAGAASSETYRLLIFPTVLGQGRRLFDKPQRPFDLDFASVESAGKAVRVVYNRRATR
jgi:hypothetical protein